jgi:hypothetical protein
MVVRSFHFDVREPHNPTPLFSFVREPGSLLGRFALRGDSWAGFATATGVADGATARFSADFNIEILRSVGGGIAPPPPKPRGGRTALAGGGAILN